MSTLQFTIFTNPRANRELYYCTRETKYKVTATLGHSKKTLYLCNHDYYTN